MEISSGTFKGSTGEQLAMTVSANQNWGSWEMIKRVDRPRIGKLGN